MAVSYGEASAESAKARRERLAPIEAEVDRLLMQGKRKVDGGKVPHDLRSEFIRIYEGAGWSVTYHSYQRDGSWYQFGRKESGDIRECR